jgi:hypothetical protein
MAKYGGTKAGVQCSVFSRFEENKFPPQVFSSEFPGISDGDKKKPLLTTIVRYIYTQLHIIYLFTIFSVTHILILKPPRYCHHNLLQTRMTGCWHSVH